MPLIVKFVGSLRHVLRSEELALQIHRTFSIKELIDKIDTGKPEFGQTLFGRNTDSSNANVLILVNGKEISALLGLKTRVKNNDKVVFVPVSHGG